MYYSRLVKRIAIIVFSLKVKNDWLAEIERDIQKGVTKAGIVLWRHYGTSVLEVRTAQVNL